MMKKTIKKNLFLNCLKVRRKKDKEILVIEKPMKEVKVESAFFDTIKV